MAASESFPKWLLACLLGPYVAYFGLPFLDKGIAFLSGGRGISGLAGMLAIIAFVVQIVAVLVAAVKLIRHERYRTAGNYVATALGAAPWVVGFTIALFSPQSMRIHF